MPPHILTYLSNVLVATPTLEEQLRELESTLVAHSECGTRLKAKWIFLFRNSIDYLVFQVRWECIRIRPEYVEKILQWPTHISRKQLRSLLRLMSYWRCFSQMYTQRLEKKITLTESMAKYWEILTAEFLKEEIRAYPRCDIDEPCEVTTDL